MSLVNLLRSFSIILLMVIIVNSILGEAISSENSFDQDLKTGVNNFFYQTDEKTVREDGLLHKYEIAYTKWTPTTPNGHVIIYNHGLQSHRGWFFETAEELKNAGFVVYAYDRIGAGESSPLIPLTMYEPTIINRRGHIHDWRIYIATLDQVKDLAKKENPSSAIHLWGNSFGAKIVTAYLLLNNKNDLASTIFSTPGLYRNEKTMPLSFSKFKFLLSYPDEYFPSPIYSENGDNGAGLFTDNRTYFEKIKYDDLSLRLFTKSFLDQANKLDNFIEKYANSSPELNQNSRFYLMVSGDPMMDNIQMLKHIKENSSNAIAKFYEGGENHRHFLSYTRDRALELSDIINFLFDNQEQIGNTIEL